jgi:3-hydroxyisobutyrate dehydrogenase-like beta-hydroxyacid dehydrogenase
VLDLPQEAWFDAGLMHKDIGLALAMARDLGIQLPSTGVAGQMLTRAAQLGYEHRDIAALFQVLTRTSDHAPDEG